MFLLFHFNLFYCRILTHTWYIPFQTSVANFKACDSHVYRSWIRSVLSHLDNKGYYWAGSSFSSWENRYFAWKHSFSRIRLIKLSGCFVKKTATNTSSNAPFHRMHVSLLVGEISRRAALSLIKSNASLDESKNRCLVTISQFRLTNRRLSILS